MAGWMLYVHALSPIHSGTGQGSGVIDLPVARETVTTWPYLPGSSIKGVLRDAAQGDGQANGSVVEIFGPDIDKASESSGAVWFSDALLLALPIRSFHGTFAWVTSPLALDRWRRDHLANNLPFTLALPPAPDEGKVLLAKAGKLDSDETVYLEDIDLPVWEPQGTEAANEATNAAAGIAGKIAGSVFPGNDYSSWRDRFVERFIVTDDETFTQLAEVGTEVAARIRLNDDSKTVARGALWYEESVPAESIFAAPVVVAPHKSAKSNDFRAALERVTVGSLQIGGHASVGKGIVNIRFGEE